MSSDLLKTLTVSLTSSFCTALFVVACTAGAEKPGHDGAHDDSDHEDDAAVEDDDDGAGGTDAGGGSGNVGDDGGDDDDGLSSADLAAVQADIASIKCFIGHMTDDQTWNSSSSRWYDISDEYGFASWDEGPNSDAMKAYEDCF